MPNTVLNRQAEIEAVLVYCGVDKPNAAAAAEEAQARIEDYSTGPVKAMIQALLSDTPELAKYSGYRTGLNSAGDDLSAKIMELLSMPQRMLDAVGEGRE